MEAIRRPCLHCRQYDYVLAQWSGDVSKWRDFVANILFCSMASPFYLVR